MNEEELKLYIVIKEALVKKPTLASVVVTAMTVGIREANVLLNKKLISSEKSAVVLFEGSNMGSDQNLVEAAEALTNSHFNGQNKKYTIDDIKPFIKKKRGRPRI